MFNLPLVYKAFNATTDTQKSKIDKRLTLYVASLIKHISKQYRNYWIKRTQYDISINDVKYEVGKMAMFNVTPTKQVWFSNHLEASGLAPYTVITKGFPGMLTTIELTNAKMQRELDFGIVEEYIARVNEAQDIDYAPIDMESLNNYITDPNSQRYPDNIKYAKRIMTVAAEFNGRLPQIVNESAFGRRYYHGINLQNAPKMVRTAALGAHYQYDLNSASYAILFGRACTIINELDPSVKFHTNFPRTMEYLSKQGSNKNRIREMLAKDAFRDTAIPTDRKGREDAEAARIGVIKTAITSIGFGARVPKDDTGEAPLPIKTALVEVFSSTVDGKTITNKRALRNLLANEWFSEFVKEQAVLSNIVYEHWKEATQPTRETHSHLYNARGISRNKVMAMIFQTEERKISNLIAEWFEARGSKILARVHDAIYTDTPVSRADLNIYLDSLTPECLRNSITALISVSKEHASTWQDKHAVVKKVTQVAVPNKEYAWQMPDVPAARQFELIIGGLYTPTPNEDAMEDMSADEKKEYLRVLYA